MVFENGVNSFAARRAELHLVIQGNVDPLIFCHTPAAAGHEDGVLGPCELYGQDGGVAREDLQDCGPGLRCLWPRGLQGRPRGCPPRPRHEGHRR